MADDLILTLNAGSSSLKFAAYGASTLDLRLAGQASGLGGGAPRLDVRTGPGGTTDLPDGEDRAAILARVLDLAAALGGRVAAVGHRVVHGGLDFAAPVVLDTETIARLRLLEPLAPLHQPYCLDGVEAARAAAPAALQIACFDTAFHRGHPFVNDAFALPRRYYEAGVRRYGFHGLSYDYVCGELARLAPDVAAGRAIVAHLGNGASMCAVAGGRSLASTMGFSALDGLPMGTRCGQLDPGVLLYLMSEEGLGAAEISDLLYKESGLKGLSGIGNDVRALEASDDPHAREALDYFEFRVRREIGAMAAALGGVDGLVFCGGIGENAAGIRERVVAPLGFLGLRIDAAANRDCVGGVAGRIDPGGPEDRPVFVIPTDEEIVIARAAAAALAA